MEENIVVKEVEAVETSGLKELDSNTFQPPPYCPQTTLREDRRTTLLFSFNTQMYCKAAAVWMYRVIECAVFPFSIRTLYPSQYHGFGFQRKVLPAVGNRSFQDAVDP